MDGGYALEGIQPVDMQVRQPAKCAGGGSSTARCNVTRKSAGRARSPAVCATG